MKRIEAVISPWTLDVFKEAAAGLGIREFELVEVYRFGCETPDRQKRIYRGSQFTADLAPRLRVEFVMFDDDVRNALDCLLELVHPESISVFRLDQEVRTISSRHPDANNSFFSGEPSAAKPLPRAIGSNPNHTDSGRSMNAALRAPIQR